VKIGAPDPKFSDTILTIASEFSVLVEYLLSAGFAELGMSKEDVVSLFGG
jgi:hypothetical protein